MNLGSYSIDDYLVFTCTTHDPSTGDVMDADSAPTYRIYKDDDMILTGVMQVLDDDNTVGFYWKNIQLTALAGFEVGKGYTILIRASVSGVDGATVRTFKLENVPGQIWSYDERTLTMPAAQVVDAVAGSKIAIYRDADFETTFSGFGDLSDADKLWFTIKSTQSGPDTAALVQIEATAGLIRLAGQEVADGDEVNGSLTVVDSVIAVFLAAEATSVLSLSNALFYDIKILRDDGSVNVLTSGSARVIPAITRSIS